MERPVQAEGLASVVVAVVAIYSLVACGLHLWVFFNATCANGRCAENFWGTLPSVWDHPEPNYVVSNAIGEFWSVLTTIPVAGTLLSYQGLKYKYSGGVFRIYLLTIAMYTLAFSAHMTLQPVVFSTTVISVMTNALMTFGQFSWVVHRVFESKLLRWLIVFFAEACLVATVLTLPYALPANGGVWTLFLVQAPGVFLATGIAAYLSIRCKHPTEKSIFRLLSQAGAFLSAAMGMSLVECLIGFDYGFVDVAWGFPWLHIIIHVFEQIGIYMYGVGLASMHELLLVPSPRVGAEIRWYGCVPFFHCTYGPGYVPHIDDHATKGLENKFVPFEDASTSADEAEQTPKRGRPVSAKQPQTNSVRRRRDSTPGAIGS